MTRGDFSGCEHQFLEGARSEQRFCSKLGLDLGCSLPQFPKNRFQLSNSRTVVLSDQDVRELLQHSSGTAVVDAGICAIEVA